MSDNRAANAKHSAFVIFAMVGAGWEVFVAAEVGAVAAVGVVDATAAAAVGVGVNAAVVPPPVEAGSFWAFAYESNKYGSILCLLSFHTHTHTHAHKIRYQPSTTATLQSRT